MKKQILNLGKALNKAEQKLINGGIPVQQGDAGGCWVKCNSGSLKQTTDLMPVQTLCVMFLDGQYVHVKMSKLIS